MTIFNFNKHLKSRFYFSDSIRIMNKISASIFGFVIFISFSLAVNAQDNISRTHIFNPSGNYHPLKRLANKSDQFIQFDLQVRRRKGKVIASGEVKGVQPWYKFIFVSVTNKSLKFSTAKVKGISYDFDGKFLGKGNFAEQWMGHGLLFLEGTLSKFVNGKKAAEVTTSFLYYPGC